MTKSRDELVEEFAVTLRCIHLRREMKDKSDSRLREISDVFLDGFHEATGSRQSRFYAGSKAVLDYVEKKYPDLYSFMQNYYIAGQKRL